MAESSSLIAAAVSFGAAEMRAVLLCCVDSGVSGSKDGTERKKREREERSYRKVGELWRRHKGTDGGTAKRKSVVRDARRRVPRPSVRSFIVPPDSIRSMDDGESQQRERNLPGMGALGN